LLRKTTAEREFFYVLNGIYFWIVLGNHAFWGAFYRDTRGLLGFFVENSMMRFLPGGRRSQDNNNFLVPLFSLFAKAAKETGGPTTRQLQFVNLLFRSQFFLGLAELKRRQSGPSKPLWKMTKAPRIGSTPSALFPLDGFRKHWLLQTTAQLLSMETGGLTPGDRRSSPTWPANWALATDLAPPGIRGLPPGIIRTPPVL
jgi:hypothetical protein